MESETMTIPCRIDGGMFRAFALFDALRRQRIWRRPACFAVFFCALSALAFSRAGATEGAALLGGVLLAVGLGLPAAYFGSFLLSVRARAKELDPGAPAYTLTLDSRGVRVEKGAQNASYRWETVDAAYRLARVVCLYVEPRRALLLPGDDDAAWELLRLRLGAERARDLRR